MFAPLLYAAVLTLVAGIIIQRFNIRVANKYRLLDIPSARRRHKQSTPITGGVGVILAWCVGLAVYTAFEPEWIIRYQDSVLAIGFSILVLVALGLFDDLKGLAPAWKLLIEFALATIVVSFEPQVNAICTHWSSTLGIFVWPMALMWIVGITNSINLIDGLDGLAGGMSALVATSIAILSLWTGEPAIFATICMATLIPAIFAFMKYNWSPAKIFLGDNGSLPLGFLIATASLMCRPQSKSWVMIASVILMLGYPILDMGLAVLRRYTKHLPLFKADRNHLHYRIQRLGLSVPQTAAMLLAIGLYLQVAALCVNLISPPSAALGIAVVCFSIFTLLYLVRSIERWRVRRIFHHVEHGDSGANSKGTKQPNTVMHIELETLLEAAMMEEIGRYQRLIAALELLLNSMIRNSDILIKTNQRISILFSDDQINVEDWKAIEERFKDKIDGFLDLYDLQCSLAGIPISFEKVSVVTTGATIAILPTLDKRAA